MVGHGIWTWHAERKLRLRVDALRAAGERMMPSDFESQQPDPPGNAAPLITAAAMIIDDGSPQSESVDCVPATQPLNPKAWPYLVDATEWYAPALRRIDLAEGKAYCRWPHSFQSPVSYHLLLPELGYCRSLARLLLTSALVEHHRGHDDVVIERLRQMLYLSRACESTPAHVGHLVALGVAASVDARVEQLSPDLRIGTGAIGGVSPRDVRTLIGELLDDSSSTCGLRFALRAERMTQLDLLQTFGTEKPNDIDAVSQYAIRPMIADSALQ